MQDQTTTYCLFCDEKRTAVVLAPQSTDQGHHVTYEPACASHAETWWEGADWGPIPFRTID